MKIKKINDVKVKPIPVESLEPSRILGYDMFPEIYSNIFIIAKKKTGKTNLVIEILKRCADKNTNIIIFASTAHNDDAYKWAKDYFEDEGINIQFFTHFIDRRHNILEDMIEDLQKEKEEERTGEDGEKLKYIVPNDYHKERKKRKPKVISPQYIIVFDDLSRDLRSRSISALTKKNRHFKAKVIISSQFPMDLPNDSRTQSDYWLLGRGIPEEKLSKVYEATNLSIPEGTFDELYYEATKKPFDFLYIDPKNETFRINFNKQIEP